MTNFIGQSLGRYHILEQLGEGGMATVYKAYDTRLERDVAVKVIRTELFGQAIIERMLIRFEREAKSIAKLSHPNIVKVLDYGEHEGKPFLVMEYLPSGTLKQKIGKPVPWRDALRFLIPIARALQVAHVQGIIHRDIKPSNILITLSGEPMLSDFGIAKIIESEETTALTGTGVGVGTPEYMAPEQWTGDTGIQSDVYSLGVVLYELITGRKPYVADTPAAILLKQATGPLPRPSHFVRDLPDTVEKMLIKALAKNPDDRYQSMEEFTTALERLTQTTTSSLTTQDTAQTILQPATTEDELKTEHRSEERGERITEAQHERKSQSHGWLLAMSGALIVFMICIIGLVFFSGWKNQAQTQNTETTQPQVIVSEQTPLATYFLPTETKSLSEVLVTNTPLIISTPTFTLLPTATLQPQFDPGNPEGFLSWWFHVIWAERYYETLWDYISPEFSGRLNTDYATFVDNWEKIGSIEEPITITFIRADSQIKVYNVKYTTLSRKGGFPDTRNDNFSLYFNPTKGHWEFK